MSFHPVIIGSDTFNQTGDGIYTKSTVTFGAPTNQVKVIPGRASKTGVSASVSRRVEKDLVVNGVTSRVSATVTFQVQAATGFTSVEIDTLLSEISTFVDQPRLDRILLGEA